MLAHIAAHPPDGAMAGEVGEARVGTEARKARSVQRGRRKSKANRKQ
jgi:hypothetical protein